MTGELEALARTRRRAEQRAARAYAALLEAALLEAARDDANVRDVARRAGIAHGTIYNELERRRRAQNGPHA
jgi:AcrR family transcriptional regulator